MAYSQGRAIAGMEIGKKVADALGLDPTRLRGIVISIPADDLVTITAEYTATYEDIEPVDKEFKKYKLAEIKEEEEGNEDPQR